MIKAKFKGEKIEGKTYAEMLELGKKWKAEADKEKADKEKKLAVLRNAIAIEHFEKGFRESDYQQYITFKLVVKNKSGKKVRAVKGELIYNDLFDEKITVSKFVYDQAMEPGKEDSLMSSISYNKFKEKDKLLKSKALKDLKIVWEPQKIIFADGSTME